MSEDKNTNGNGIPPDCLIGDKDCYRLFSSLLKDVRTIKDDQQQFSTTQDKIYAALVGDDLHPEEGLVIQIRKQEKRIKTLEKVYLWALAVITVGGTLIGVFSKLGITIGK